MREEVIPAGFFLDLEWKSCETDRLVVGLFIQIGMKLWGIQLPVGSFSETLWCIGERACSVLLELLITPRKSNINARYQKWPYFLSRSPPFPKPIILQVSDIQPLVFRGKLHKWNVCLGILLKGNPEIPLLMISWKGWGFPSSFLTKTGSNLSSPPLKFEKILSHFSRYKF